MRFHVPVTLRWSDLDAYGHVNNASLLHLLEEARIATFWSADELDTNTLPVSAVAILNARPGSSTRSVIAHQEIEYRAQIPYLRSPLDVQLWFGKIGGASFDLFYEVWSPNNREQRTLFARAATTLVLIDSQTQRPRRITPRERESWSRYIDEPLVFRRGH